jgi:hypothetical protein
MAASSYDLSPLQLHHKSDGKKKSINFFGQKLGL